MANNIGKKFENNWKASMPNDIFYYRLKDQAQSFGGASKLRFSLKIHVIASYSNPLPYLH